MSYDILQILAVDLCCSDRIFLYDGPDPHSILLYAVRQNTESGTTIISTGNTVYVHMQLLAHWSCNGAIISFKAGKYIKELYVTGNTVYVHMQLLAHWSCNGAYVHMQLLANWSCNGASIYFKVGTCT